MWVDLTNEDFNRPNAVVEKHDSVITNDLHAKIGSVGHPN